MADGTKAKITYLTLKLCVAVKTTRREWLPDSLLPLDDLLQRAKRKLGEKKTSGDIVDFFILQKPLLAAWERIGRQDPTTNPDVEIYIPFGYGVKVFPGVNLEKSPVVNGPCVISIRAAATEAQSWNIHALASYVVYTAMKNGWSGGAPDLGQLKKIVSNVLQGQSVERVPIVGLLRPAASSPIKAPPRKVVKGVSPLQTQSAGGLLPTAKSELTTTLKVVPPAAVKPALQGVLAGTVVPAAYPGKGVLCCQVAPDKMKAQISGFNKSTYEDKSLILDEVWLKREIVGQGFVTSSADLIERVLGLIKRQQDLNGLVVAQGTEGLCGSGPDVRAVIPKANADVAAVKEGLRQTKVIPYYRKGEVVAEVYYKTPGSPGTDIYGNPTPPPPDPPYKPELGEGIAAAGDTKFEALRDGLLKMEKGKLEVVQTYMHQGDVSLASGDLDFDGTIIIVGDIDNGCSVTARGDLDVQGSIRAANVRCFGNLTVKGGINTGMKASVHVGASITADYIENSVIYCKGDINVTKALLSSRVFTGGSISLVDANGRLAGGQFFFWDKINTSHIGFVTGALTKVYMGVDWREAMREHILTGRLVKLEAYLEKAKGEQRELLRKTQGQMTPRHQQLREAVKEHLSLAKKLIEVVTARHKALRDSLKFNPDAMVTVRAELAGDVVFLIKDAKVLGDGSVSEFTVKTKATNNTHFSKINDGTAEGTEKKSA